jgi:hypothetical protein
MAVYPVYTDVQDEDPIKVDDDTHVSLNDDHQIVIVQRKPGRVSQLVRVEDPEALTRALAKALLIQAERRAVDQRPMLAEQRKAIFAGLREMYGTISRERRLAILSAMVGRQVHTMSTANYSLNPLTRAEAGRILDILNA